MTGQGKNEIDLLLAAGLKELAAQKPIEKITIKEIADKAGVIRPTFYNHFQDKYELLEWIIRRELLEPVWPLVEKGQVAEAVTQLLNTIAENKAFYARAVRMEGVISFEDVAHKCLKEMLLTTMQERMKIGTGRYEWLTPDLMASYYAQTICLMITTWVADDMTIPPQELAETYQYMMTHSMEEILLEYVIAEDD
jgi:probable dihydroxyacetone kinase regulator